VPRDRDPSFRRGFGFGLGLSLGNALVRIVFALIGFGLILMLLNSLLSKL
jgi:hypothetical protein